MDAGNDVLPFSFPSLYLLRGTRLLKCNIDAMIGVRNEIISVVIDFIRRVNQ